MTEFWADRRFRRMVALLLTTETLWGLGSFFVLPATTIPAFLHAHHAGPPVIGMMAIAMGALMLPSQLFGRTVVDKFRCRKLGIVCIHVGGLLPYFVIAGFDRVFLLPERWVVALTIALLALSAIILGLVIPVWIDMLAQVIPLEIRGRYFGIASGCFSLGGIAGGTALAGLQRWFPASVFPAAFLAAGCCFSLSMTAFALAPVPESAFAHPPEPPLLPRLRTMLAACHFRTDFGRLVASYSVQALAMTLVPFLVVYATDAHGLHLPAGIFARMTVWQAVGGAGGALLLGWLTDRLGPRWPWVGITLVIPLVALCYPFARVPAVLWGCSMLIGLLTTHWSASGPAMLEYSPEGDKSGYIAIANVAGFVPGLVGPLLLALLIDGAGYHAAFLAALLAGLLALVLALMIRGRRTAHTRTPQVVNSQG